MNKLLGILALTLAAPGCTVSRTVNRPDGSSTTTTFSVPAEYRVGTVWHCAPTVYYYQPATVHFVASYCHWPRSRVEYYFSIGWTCDDLIIGFEFSRRSRRPWREVSYYYESSRHRHSGELVATGCSGREVWQDVAQHTGDSHLTQITSTQDSFNTYVDQSQHTAITQVYNINIDQSTHINQVIQDNSIDIGAIVTTIENNPTTITDASTFVAIVKEEDAKLEALENRVEAGDTAGLTEAVPDSKEPDWDPSKEDKVDDAPAGMEEPKEEPKEDSKDEPKKDDEPNRR